MKSPIIGRMTLLLLAVCLPGCSSEGTWFPSTEKGEYNRCKAYPLPLDSIRITREAAFIWLDSRVDTNKLVRNALDTLVFAPRIDSDTILIKVGKSKSMVYLKAKSGAIMEVKQLRRRVKMIAIPCD